MDPVLTGLAMSGMNGLDLAVALRTHNLRVPVIPIAGDMSGDGAKALANGDVAAGRVRICNKRLTFANT